MSVPRLACALGLWLTCAQMPRPPVFLAQRIDGPVEQWYGPFAEAAAVFDVDKDGFLDITCGANWYKGPAFHPRPLREVETRGEFVGDGAEFAYDVNGDGWTDLISASWFEDQTISWYENNRNVGGLWKKRFVADAPAIETFLAEDIDRDGQPELLPNHWKPTEVYWIEIAGGRFERRVVGRHGGRHGLGVGDVDLDGRKDILTPDGWYRAPRDAKTGEWEWRPEWRIEGLVGVPMLSLDVNRDGRSDVVFGMGHDYGLYWLEQGADGARRTWRRRVIDESWSQAHALALGDINGDGRLDLVTGKRLRGHEERDPGSLEPLGLYWYEFLADGRINRHVLSYNAMVGTGMGINLPDIDRDGDLDIVVGGKAGLFLLENMKLFSKRTPGIIQRGAGLTPRP